ncbi:MAG: hypothetical protein JO161_01415 [Planctomycetaceae bacterium]|nr:hypothetical protein [Planctomycetaceae bacterium]
MTTDELVDHLKQFLQLCIKYRFWISIGLAALFAIIAYLVGSSPVIIRAEQEKRAILQADSEVKKFTSPGIPNDQYKPIVAEKTDVLNKDINSAWKQLYNRQVGLLTWPKSVHDRFHTWGREWPENVAEGAVQLAIDDYIHAYDKYVDSVYKVFSPFDAETGSGIVSAPPKEALLRPAVFDSTRPPELGTIWDAQERLWIQRTLLELVAQVNKNAKDWDSAIIKQINELEVGSSIAQDQRSLAKGDQLTESEAIRAPGSEPQETADSSSRPVPRPTRSTGSESIYYVKPAVEATQFRIVPVILSVLIDQDHIQDLLVEFENSPMSIQVMDFELRRPEARVIKPEPGVPANFAMRAGGLGFPGMSGYGGMISRMSGGRPSGYAGMGGAAASSRPGTSKRNRDRGKQREEETKSVESAKGPSLFDPHYDIAMVRIYGQARLYKAPPADAEIIPSLGATVTTVGTEDAKQAITPEAEPEKNETTGAEAPKDELPKAEASQAEPSKNESPKS